MTVSKIKPHLQDIFILGNGPPACGQDFAGPIESKMLIIIVDSHSKWIETFAMENATSSATIRYLRPVFAQFGIPKTVASESGTQFFFQRS